MRALCGCFQVGRCMAPYRSQTLVQVETGSRCSIEKLLLGMSCRKRVAQSQVGLQKRSVLVDSHQSDKFIAVPRLRVLTTVAVVGVVVLLLMHSGFTLVRDKSFLRLAGQLVNKDTRKPVGNAVVTLVGAGLPAQTRTGRNGLISAFSSSPAQYVQVKMVVAGYKPYTLLLTRQEPVTSCLQCMLQDFLLTPMPRPHRATAHNLKPVLSAT